MRGLEGLTNPVFPTREFCGVESCFRKWTSFFLGASDITGHLQKGYQPYLDRQREGGLCPFWGLRSKDSGLVFPVVNFPACGAGPLKRAANASGEQDGGMSRV